MGTTFHLTFYASSDRVAQDAAEASFRRIDDLNRIMSDYDPLSELSKLSSTAGTGQRVRLSPELLEVLSLADEIASRSGGAFDVTVGPFVRLWRETKEKRQLPDPVRLAQAKQSVGFEKIKLHWVTPHEGVQDEGWAEAQLMAEGMQLDLGGIAKGYAADQILLELQRHGIQRALIDAGGDIRVSGPPPGTDGWTIGVAGQDGSVDRRLVLADAAVATSGDTWRYVEIAGKRYSHIVDPVTGLGLEARKVITVIVKSKASHNREGVCPMSLGAIADAAASAYSVLENRSEHRQIIGNPQIEIMVLRAADQSMHRE